MRCESFHQLLLCRTFPKKGVLPPATVPQSWQTERERFLNSVTDGVAALAQPRDAPVQCLNPIESPKARRALFPIRAIRRPETLPADNSVQPFNTMVEEAAVNDGLLPTLVDCAGEDPGELQDIDGVSLADQMAGNEPKEASRNQNPHFHNFHEQRCVPNLADTPVR